MNNQNYYHIDMNDWEKIAFIYTRVKLHKMTHYILYKIIKDQKK